MATIGAHVVVDGLRILYRTDDGAEAAAVDDVSFALPRGARLGVVGESGSGKSTLARALLAHVRPGARIAAGRIAVGGQDVLALGGAGLRAFRGGRAAMAPQNPLSSLTPHMTVGRQLTELIGVHLGLRGAAARERALALMAQTDLPDPAALFRRYPHELSGGQRQRVVIAAALVAEPELIVLDEPTTALDKTVEARVLELVDRLAARLGATLVYVSHDLNVIGRMCERVMVMRAGRVVEEAPVGALFARPRTPYARDLVAALPRLDPAVLRRPPAQDGPPTLRVEGVSFAYPARGGLFRRAEGPRAVDGLDFAVRPGETVGLVGESGSGKSTVALLIAGALSGHRGTIRLGEATLAGPARRRDAALRRRVQMVFQDPLSSLNPAQSVDEILRRPLQLYFGMGAAAARAEALRLLDEMELPSTVLTRGPRQLSGGQQQRVAIARALAAQPDLLLCDEITSALDVTIQAQVLALLRRLQEERGLACLFISHDLAVVASMAHRILVLERGQLRDHGPAERVLRNPATPYAARLLAAFADAAADRRPAIA